MTDHQAETSSPRFAIFRGREARPEEGIPIMSFEPPPPLVAEWSGKLSDAGVAAGHENRLLFSGGGFSLAYVWFKSGYPLPRHSHDADCLYYIVGGSLRFGDEELGVGDGFFVGCDVPYTYLPGPEGVEVLEFRASEAFNIEVLVKNAAFWGKALQTVIDSQEQWREEPRPSATPW